MFTIISTMAGLMLSSGVLAWIFQLGNRVTALEAKAPDLKELIEVRFDALNDRLERIERSMNGHFHKD